ncbi:helix-turn-helix transcriptional regulator [Clostridium paraputrificum]|uniref:helix-turn-helix transcriptional regulator n=1 Tax=Clostridium paraputrificum TaxID=29363 RepID=UPI0012B978EA|nr:transcriptional regulator [Clostridium paraputrificum]
MSNLEKVLKMLFKLKSGRLIKKQELARELEVSEKQISRYKKTLNEFFTIESIPGPGGGYRLLNSYFPFKELLTEEELILLKYYSKSLQYIDNDKLAKALDKINYSILKDDSQESTQIIPYSRINNARDIRKIQSKLYEAVLHKNEVIISYTSNEGAVTRRMIQPYKLFVYKGEYYVVAMCLLKKQLRFFKLVRITEIILTSVKFEVSVDVEELLKEAMDNNIGIFSGKEYNLKLIVCPPMANTIRERIWVDNQVVTELEDGEILFKANMKGGAEIISWILSMRSYVKVIEPEFLKVELYEEVEKMMKNLKK